MRLKSILIVDDDEVNNFILKELFQEYDVADAIEFCSSVDGGFEYLNSIKAKNGTFPELIILDINMPFKDGFDFLEEYYEQGFNFNRTNIVLLTSSLFDKDRVLASKYDRVLDFLTKPLSHEKLANVVKQINHPES